MAKAQPGAQFNATPLSGCTPLVVSFHDLSIGSPTQWKWDLGNSTISFLQNPIATYFNPGVYTIKLVVENALGKDSIIKINYITVYALPTVSFSANVVTGCYPLPVQFSNTSIPGSTSITSYLWDFGDGNSSTQANPAHIYNASGIYNVSLRVTNDAGCTKTLTLTNYINITSGVDAVFTNSAQTSCNPPTPVVFQNLSTGTGTLNYQWDFGDGNTSIQANPSHIYNATGTYTVQLIAISNIGCTDTITHTVTISSVQANFTEPATICVGAPALFVNTSVPTALSALWTFGDATGSTLISPVKTYTIPGTYNVKLVSNFGVCKDSITKTIVVLPKPANAFTGTPLISCVAPLTVTFSNTTTGASSYQWNFGDGNTSSTAAPVHTYTSTGNYTVTLITTNANGCRDTLIKQQYIKIQEPNVVLNNLPQQGCAPFTWTFAATVTSIDPITNYLWDFGDGNTSTAINPTHTFAAGVYDIQLIITTAGGCKDTIRRLQGIRSTIKPVPNFSATPREVCAFVPVVFTDLSTGTVSEWHWLFGDGGSSTTQNPSHEYTDTGYFTVTLIVGNYGCYDTLVMPNYIHVNPPIALFNVILNCNLPFVRTFTDQSIGADEWTWDFGDGNTSTLQNPIHIYATAGVFNVTLTVRNLTTGCSHSRTTPVIVADELADFAATQTVLCKQVSTTFNAVLHNVGGISNYSWLFGDGGSGSGNPVSHIYTASGLYSVRLIITDAAGCKDTTIKLNYIQVNGPIANFNASVAGSCLLSSVTFNDLSTTDGFNALVTWNWDYGDGIIETLTAPPFTHSYAGAGVYSVKLKITDAVGCTDSITKINLLIISTPVAAFSSVDTLSCPTKPIVFSNSSTGPGLSFLWNFGDGNTSTAATPTHAYAAAGIYSVQLMITDMYGCTDQIIKTNFIKIVAPVASFTVNDSVGTCPPLIVLFTNTSINQNTYQWDFGDGNFSNAISPSHFYNVAGSYMATLSITGPGGCVSVASKQITISGPRGDFSYTNIAGCKPLTVNFVATSLARTAFIWDFNDGNTITTTDSVISHTYTIPGIYVPKIILLDATGCTVPITGADTIVVTGVTANFTADTLLFCSYGSVQFTNASLSNDMITGYLWDFGDGNTSTAVSPAHFYATEGIFTPKLKVFTAMGCVDSLLAPVPVKIVKTPSIGITQSPNGCVPLQMNFTGNLLNADTSAIKWRWTFSDGRIDSLKILSPVLFNTAGIYNLQLIATNSSGCKDTAISSLEAFALPDVIASADKMICLGTGQNISAAGAVTYAWTPTTGLSCINCVSPVANPAVATTYFVTGATVNGCKDTDSITVSVKYPFTMIHGRGDTLCVGESASLTASGAATYLWTPTTGLNNSTSATVNASPTATTNYMLVGTDSLGCFKDTAYFPIVVYPIPVVAAGPDITMNVGQTITITPTISADITSAVWSPTTSIVNTVFPSVTIKPKETTQYRVDVYNGGGCTSSDLVMVFVLCNGANVFIPNTFSPNGDAANEVFFPRGTGLFTIKSARIFNRWGEVVFEKYNMTPNQASAGWDGTYKGQKLGTDVFIYMFEIICENKSVLIYKGDIALIR